MCKTLFPKIPNIPMIGFKISPE